MFEDLNDLYQQVILDHCKKPRNFHELPAATCSAQGFNPLCGDQLKLFLALDGNTIKDISFVGSGCCISKASASLLTEFAKGKTKTDMEKIQGDLSKTKQNLDAIQSELTTTKGQLSPSKVEIEGVQNNLNEIENQLDTLYRQNADAGAK